MRKLAIITARGGSKRIPKKNIKEFCKKPIIEYSISAALTSGIFDKVMVSTDSKEIADVAIKAGAQVPFLRSEKNSDDYASTVDVLIEVVEEFRKIGENYDEICCLYPTAPFITKENLVKAKDMLKNSNITSVITITEFSFPPQRGFRVNNDDMIEYINPGNAFCRSQDLEKVYHDCGQFYFIKTESLLTEKTLVTKNSAPIIINAMHVQDIDTITDWQLAELKYKLINE